jgi:hypothetical protein
VSSTVAPLFVWVFVPLFFAGFVFLIVWAAIMARMFRRLSNDHPEAYEAMGRPTLFWNYSTRSGWLFMRFLLRRKYVALGDERLEQLGHFMFGFGIAYLLLFAVLSIVIVLGAIGLLG